MSKCRKLGWEAVPGESHFNILLRGEILQALAFLGHEETHREALQRFQSFLNDRNTPLLSADTRDVIYVYIHIHIHIYIYIYILDIFF